MPEAMSSLERARTTIEGGIPDQVPTCVINFPNVAAVAGISVRDYCLNPTQMAEAQINYWQECGQDIIDIETGVCALAEACGCEVEYPEDAPPWVTKRIISSLDEIDRLEEIDPHQSRGAAALINGTRLVAEKLGDRVCVRGESDQGPFNLAAQILGMEKLLIALTEPENEPVIHKLLEYCSRQTARLARAQIAAGSHYTLMGESTSGPDVCSPKTYRQFALPHETRLIQQLRREGVEIGMHMCGNATPIIPDMVTTGALYFELDYKIDRLAVRRATQETTTLFGMLDPGNLLPLGSPDQVYTKAKEDVLLMGQKGRYVLNPGCALPLSTPLENVQAMIRAAHDFGKYGPDGTLVENGSSAPA